MGCQQYAKFIQVALQRAEGIENRDIRVDIHHFLIPLVSQVFKVRSFYRGADFDYCMFENPALDILNRQFFYPNDLIKMRLAKFSFINSSLVCRDFIADEKVKLPIGVELFEGFC